MDRQFTKESSERSTFIFGIRAIIEAVNAGKDIESVYIQRGTAGTLLAELKEALRNTTIPVNTVPVEKLNRLTRKNHQGAIAIMAPITYSSIYDIIPQVYERGEVPLILVLDSVTDVRNMGAIARTAYAAGVHAMVIPMRETAQVNGDAVKASAGALFNIPVCRHASLPEVLDYLLESGLQTVACTEKTNELIYGVDMAGPTAIIMGNEERGISNNLLRTAQVLAKIPMPGNIGSLNVSVATALIVYEAVRQRLK